MRQLRLRVMLIFGFPVIPNEIRLLIQIEAVAQSTNSWAKTIKKTELEQPIFFQIRVNYVEQQPQSSYE
jgi:hypothetical protein